MGLDQYLRARTNTIEQNRLAGLVADYFPLHRRTKEQLKSDTGVKRMPFRIILDKSLKYMMISTLKIKKYLTTKYLKSSTTQMKYLIENRSETNTK